MFTNRHKAKARKIETRISQKTICCGVIVIQKETPLVSQYQAQYIMPYASSISSSSGADRLTDVLCSTGCDPNA